MKTGRKWGGVLLGVLAFLAMSFGAVAEKKMATLMSADGKTIKAELLEKGRDKVKVRLGRKVYMLPFDKLSEESVALVKEMSLPMICDFRLTADFTKRSGKVEKDRIEMIEDENMTVTDSYRIDTISGEIKVENRDVKDGSPKATLHVAVLCRAKPGKVVIRREKYELEPIEPLMDESFPVGEAKTWHTERGRPLRKPKNLVGGRYSGYIAAVVIEGRIVELKTMPESLERDVDEVRKLLDLDREEKEK